MHDESDAPPIEVKESPKKLSQNERIMAAMLLAAMFALCCATSLTAISTEHETDSIRPEMQALAEEGKPEAVLWVGEHSTTPDISFGDKLQAAAETGHPESMYRYALFMGYRGQPDEKQAWMQKAADAGYPQAVLIMHNKNAISATR